MDTTMKHTTELPITNTKSRVVGGQSTLRQYSAIIVKAVLGAFVLGLCLALVYQAISDKQSYDELLNEYGELLNKDSYESPIPYLTLKARNVESDSVSYTYSTTTLTQGATITLTATSTVDAVLTTTATSTVELPTSSTHVGTCAAPTTVTVTVHDAAGTTSGQETSSSSSSSVESSSSWTTITTSSTRIVTTTVIVTASGGDSSNSSDSRASTTTSFVGAVGGGNGPSITGHGPFRNTTSATLVATERMTTVNYTLTLPQAAGTTGFATSSGKQLTPHSTTTIANNPAGETNPIVMSAGSTTAVAGGRRTVVLIAALAALVIRA